MNKLYLWHRGELTIQVMQIVSEWLLFNANFFIVLTHWNNSPRVDMWHHSDTLSWFQANQSLLFLLNVACLAEKQHLLIL
jgi:hypothetical protein